MGNLMTDSSKGSFMDSDLKSKIQSAENAVTKSAQNAVKKVKGMATDLVDTTSEYVQESKEYVQENPAKSIAFAAVAGAVAGGLITYALCRKQG